MRKYFMLIGYLIPTTINDDSSIVACNTDGNYKNGGYSIPHNHTFLKLSDTAEIKIVFYDSDIGHFLLKCLNRQQAYYIADIIRSFFAIYYGWSANNKKCFFLQELNKIPNSEWSKDDLFKTLLECKSISSELEFLDISSGTILNKASLDNLKKFLLQVYFDSDLCDSMNHLLESKFLFDGFMTNSYYHCHYSIDRKYMPKWIAEKRFFENRLRYESAFLAAFKGIERYFRVNDFSKNEINDLFTNINYKNLSSNTTYIRYYEIFSGQRKKIKYGELLEHFLLLRNVVAAHGNKKPPEKCLIIEDNIFEIQSFLDELIYKAVDLVYK